MDCSGPQVSDSGTVDAESCCTADTPLSYMPSGGGACMPCQGTHVNFLQKLSYNKIIIIVYNGADLIFCRCVVLLH